MKPASLVPSSSPVLLLSIAVVALGGVQLGCARAPEPELAAARTSVAVAHEPLVARHQPDVVKDLDRRLAEAVALMQTEDDKIRVLRSYKKARRMLVEVDAAAKRAIAEAEDSAEQSERAAMAAKTGEPCVVDLKREPEGAWQVVRSGPQRQGGMMLSPTLPLFEQIFILDDKAEAATPRPGGNVAYFGCPCLPIYLTGSKPGGPQIQQVFPSTDFSHVSLALTGEPAGISVARLQRPDKTKLAGITIEPERSSSVFVSHIYRAYPGDMRATSRGGPFVTVRFSRAKEKSAVAEGDELAATRNGVHIARQALGKDPHLDVALGHVLENGDLVEWSLKRGATALAQGRIAFPVTGAVPGLVRYEVIVEPPTANPEEDKAT